MLLCRVIGRPASTCDSSVPGYVVLIDEPDSRLGAIVSQWRCKTGDSGSGAGGYSSRAASYTYHCTGDSLAVVRHPRPLAASVNSIAQGAGESSCSGEEALSQWGGA